MKTKVNNKGVFYAPTMQVLTTRGWVPFRNLGSVDTFVYLEDKEADEYKVGTFETLKERIDEGVCVYRDSEYHNFFTAYSIPFPAVIHPVKERKPALEHRLDFYYETRRRSTDDWFHMYNNWKGRQEEVVDNMEGFLYYLYCIVLERGRVLYGTFRFNLYNDDVRIEKAKRVLDHFGIQYRTWEGVSTYTVADGTIKDMLRTDFIIEPCEEFGDDLFMHKDGGGYVTKFFFELSEAEKRAVYCFMEDYILTRRSDPSEDFLYRNYSSENIKRVKLNAPFITNFIETALIASGWNTSIKRKDGGQFEIKFSEGHRNLNFSPTLYHKDAEKLPFNKPSTFCGIKSDKELFFVRGDTNSYYHLNYGRITDSIIENYENNSREIIVHG